MFSSFAFLPGVGDVLYLYLGNICNGKNGVSEAHPKLLWDSEQHPGFLSEQQKETGRAELGVDVQRARSSRSSSAGLLLDPVLLQQRGLERSSWLGFSGDIGSVGNERSESRVLFLPAKGICGVGEGNFFFWLSHISAFLHRSWAGDQAASQPCEFPARPLTAPKTPSRQRMGRDDASWWSIRGHSAALGCSAQLPEPEL